MQDLNYELKQLCVRNRDGSFATQVNRERILTLIANQLREMGFVNMHAQSLKPRHVEARVQRWLAEGLCAGTLKNRMAALRWWAEKIGKPNVVAKSNEVYNDPTRSVTLPESGRLKMQKRPVHATARPTGANRERMFKACFTSPNEVGMHVVSASLSSSDV